MNLADTSTFQQAVQLAQSGQKEAAYGQFSSLARMNSNSNDPDLLLWIAYATPHREEAQQALNSVANIAPSAMTPSVREEHENGFESTARSAPLPGIITPTLVLSSHHCAGWVTLEVAAAR